MTLIEKLVQIRDRLAQVDTIASSDIGVEPNISAESYPLARVVPTRMAPKGHGFRDCEADVFIGVNVTAAEGMDTVYSSLIYLEGEIIEALREIGCRYIETITDEDRLDTYKLFLVRCSFDAALQ